MQSRHSGWQPNGGLPPAIQRLKPCGSCHCSSRSFSQASNAMLRSMSWLPGTQKKRSRWQPTDCRTASMTLRASAYSSGLPFCARSPVKQTRSIGPSAAISLRFCAQASPMTRSTRQPSADCSLPICKSERCRTRSRFAMSHPLCQQPVCRRPQRWQAHVAQRAAATSAASNSRSLRAARVRDDSGIAVRRWLYDRFRKSLIRS